MPAPKIDPAIVVFAERYLPDVRVTGGFVEKHHNLDYPGGNPFDQYRFNTTVYCDAASRANIEANLALIKEGLLKLEIKAPFENRQQMEIWAEKKDGYCTISIDHCYGDMRPCKLRGNKEKYPERWTTEIHLRFVNPSKDILLLHDVGGIINICVAHNIKGNAVFLKQAMIFRGMNKDNYQIAEYRMQLVGSQGAQISPHQAKYSDTPTAPAAGAAGSGIVSPSGYSAGMWSPPTEASGAGGQYIPPHRRPAAAGIGFDHRAAPGAAATTPK